MPRFKVVECEGCGRLLYDEDFIFEYHWSYVNDDADIVGVVDYYCLSCYEKRFVPRMSDHEKRKWEEWKKRRLGVG